MHIWLKISMKLKKNAYILYVNMYFFDKGIFVYFECPQYTLKCFKRAFYLEKKGLSKVVFLSHLVYLEVPILA